MTKDNLGDRQKLYEKSWDPILPRRMPIIGRFDGVNFSSYTKGCKRPFDDALINALNNVAIALCKKIQGAQIAYCQSDEITILIHNYKTHDTQPWLKNRLIKMCAKASEISANILKEESIKIFGKSKDGGFDARFFVVPENDVNNNFLWRQLDCRRNAISMVAQSLYSDKDLFRKNSSQKIEMIKQKGIDYESLPHHYRYGRCVVKESIFDFNKNCNRSVWKVDNNIPIFSKEPNYIEQYLKTQE
jgi:tRNA(His) 5'-end guanylyltransferase